MERNQDIFRILLHVIFGSIFCILFGYFFCGSNIFIMKLTTFQFVVYGIVGSIFYALLKYRDIRTAWMSLAALFILTLSITRVRAPLRVIAIAIGFVTIAASMIIYSRFIVRHFRYIKVGKFIAYSLIFALCTAILTMIYGWIQQYPDMYTGLKSMLMIWLLIGAGLGLGLEFAGLILHREELRTPK